MTNTVASASTTRQPTSKLMWASLIALLGAVVYASLAQGAFYAHQAWVFWLFVLLGGLVSLVAAARLGLVPARRIGWLIPLAGSILLSGLNAQQLGAAAPALATVVAVCSAFLVAYLADEVGRRWLLGGLIGVGVIVATTAIIGTIHRYEPWSRLVNGLWRGASSLTYSNAAAALIVPLLLVVVAGLTRAGRRRDQLVVAHVLAVGVVATLSRGGALALVVGTAILIGLIGVTPTTRAMYPVLAGLVVSGPAVLLVASDDATISPVWAWLAIVVGIAITALFNTLPFKTLPSNTVPSNTVPSNTVPSNTVPSSTVLPGTRRLGTRRRRDEWVFVFALGLAAVSVAAVIAVDSSRGSDGGTLVDRLTPNDRFRAGEWGAAWSVFESAPLLGVGPGQAEYRFDVDGESFVAQFAHQEYLEVAAEQGLVGLVSLFSLIAATFVALARSWSRTRDPHVAGVLAGAVAFTVHSGLDFLWHIPLLPVVMAAVVATALSPSATRAARDPVR